MPELGKLKKKYSPFIQILLYICFFKNLYFWPGCDTKKVRTKTREKQWYVNNW